MPEVVMRAPKFVTLLASAADVTEKTIHLTFGGLDRKKYAIDLSMSCAALTIAATAANLGTIFSILPEAEHPPVQPIVVKSAQTAMRDNGALALLLTLESGGELPLEFRHEDLSGLSEQFAELARIANKESHH